MKNRILPILVSLIIVLGYSGNLSAASTRAALPTPTGNTCQQKLGAVNYRSSLLQAYKKKENNRYKHFRALWMERISYAGQWVPKDAQKARSDLYKYDSLHNVSMKEIDRQIVSYQPLQIKPLDCSKAKQAQLNKALASIKGLDKKKAVSGNALIEKDIQTETDFVKAKLDKSTAKMVQKLHQTKQKHPQPQHAKLEIKPVY